MSNSEVSLLDLGVFLWRHRALIAVMVIVGAACGIAAAFLLRHEYRAESVFIPVNDSGMQGPLAQLGSQLGGLASLAGLNISNGNDGRQEAIQLLRSRAFTADFIQRHRLMPVLFANEWDARAKNWKAATVLEQPTLNDATEMFDEEIRRVSEDKRTGIVTLAITWPDRTLVARWANDLVVEADAALRKRALHDTERNIQYLEAEAARATVVEVRETIYGLMESQLKNSMLARTRKEFAFRVLDPAVTPDPEDFVAPRRALLVVIGALAGGVFGLLLALGLAVGRRPRAAAA